MGWLTQLPDDWWTNDTSISLDPRSIVELTDELLFITRTLLLETRTYGRACKRLALSPADFQVALDTRCIHQRLARATVDEPTVISVSSLIERTDSTSKRNDGIRLTMHWLAIDGEEPIIPENPTPTFDEHKIKDLQPMLSSSPNICSEILAQQSPLIQKLFTIASTLHEQ